jgi:hypothetical protein
MIAAFTRDGQCTGATIISELDNTLAFALYGDDPTSDVKEGFIDGEAIIFKALRQSSGKLIDLQLSWDEQLQHSGNFETNALSAVVRINTGATGIFQPAPQSLSIYPNPTKGTFTISGLTGAAEIQLFNGFGKEVFHSKTILPASIEFVGQPKGVYHLKTQTKAGVYFNKLIIN